MKEINTFTKYLSGETSKIIDKINSKQKLTYDELIIMIENGFEMQFYYGKRKFGMTQFDGYEFYEWNKLEGYQTYSTIEEFSRSINIDGVFVKDIWQNIKKTDFAD